ncbi:nucleoside hydrolase [Curvivirga aplysinae]|uniref:nucleoside hydrolase n=1 Tax=Curvivirga aplysinae TaxID=2529852 RepID=UPI0012BCEEFD|nr:nucleoside hydrolase [Curvivirga aplysinae]MTI08461.1 nucleoside hydrolase [Curvivirga aplysinae]
MRQIILDCDPGLDDAVAIMMALGASEKIEILGITTVAGNVGLDAVYQNARNLCSLAGREDIPVFQGCPHSIMGKHVRAAEVHGSDGVGGVILPSSTREHDVMHSVDFIVDTCMNAEDKSITICPTGPMTNLAVALIKAPEIEDKIREIIFMGGVAFGPGNCTPAAEFNIYADPHAAQIVIQADIPKVMMGLDVTHQTPCTEARLDELKAIGTEPANAIAAMMEAYRRLVRSRDHGQNDCMMHDPCVIAYLLEPDLFAGRNYYVEVDTHDGVSHGRTLADGLSVSKKAPNVKIMEKIDDEGFYQLLYKSLRDLG